ncbi:MAG: HDIG domain-containing protein, partial [Clostridia bacterium]|nr:HDIG domain-containing protein [Clostridia bacterium]
MKGKKRTHNPATTRTLKTVAIVLVTYLVLFGLLYYGVQPEQYDLKIGMPAPLTIKATKDIQDTVTTDALREAAANAVEPSYKSTDLTIVDEVMGEYTVLTKALRTYRAVQNGDGSVVIPEGETVPEDVAAFNAAYNTTLTEDQMNAMLQAENAAFEEILTASANELNQALSSSLPEGQEAAALRSIRANLAKTHDAVMTSAVADLVRVCIRPTMVIDEEITEENRQRARDSVEPEMCVKDEVIVREGEILTAAQYTMIASLGLLAEDSPDYQLILGVAVPLAFMIAALGFYLSHYRKAVFGSPKKLLLLGLIMIIVVALSPGMGLIRSQLMPVSLGLLLVALLFDPRMALYFHVLMTIMAAYLTPAADFMPMMLSTVISGPIIAAMMERQTQRMGTLLAGVVIAAIKFLSTLSMGLYNNAVISTICTNASWSALGGFISAIVCIGVQPVLETTFNLATTAKLVELSNPNQKLMRRLLLEASGTYHHSIIVANLAEAACTAIGGNGLLARVGAYYHDIGKLKRPQYFKENQMGDNPHDRTDPRVSVAILTAHTRDGAQLAQKEHIPEPIVDIIRQHHGDTPATYFYDKAVKLYGDDLDISAFRYEGPRPQSREAACVMLADGVEAATRSMQNPDPEKIDDMIHKIVQNKMTDGQLDRSNLTFNDLDKICSAFSTVLTGVFHERIEYPDVVIPPRRETKIEETPEPEAETEAPAAEVEMPEIVTEPETAFPSSAVAVRV